MLKPRQRPRRAVILLVALLSAVPLAAWSDREVEPFDDVVARATGVVQRQLARTAEALPPTAYPSATTPAGTWATTSAASWTSGFFPGALWLQYQQSSEESWAAKAQRWQAGVEGQKRNTATHDVGFMILNSFGHGYRLTGEDHYRRAVLEAAASLASRYSPIVRSTRSWNSGAPLEFRVIIDNMMNLELLFWAAKHGGERAWHDIAVSHAVRTMQEHVRPDGSTYHLVAYDPATGAAKRKATVQGYRDDSTWARGQAWALYGFTVAYRETGDERFLATARRTADYFVAHLPEDKVPYWDFQAPNIPAEPRDSSAAAIAASGLLELSRRETDGSRARGYLDVATAILRSLSSESYLAARTQSMAVLLHGTLHKPRGLFDTGLVFGDYYYLEALLRYRLVPPTTPALPVAAATASDDASNAANTLDGDLGTRWRASRPEGWICYDLGEVRTVSKVSIALARGDERATRLRFDTSTDGLAWSARARAISAATTLRPETFDLPDARARYVRVVGLGTSAGPDTGITEVSIH